MNTIPNHNSDEIERLNFEWTNAKRWDGITRTYKAKDVIQLRPSIDIKYTLAEIGSKRLWELLHLEEGVRALGALTGNQAIQQVKAGLKAIYLSGWQVAADNNLSGEMYPDQSLYPSNSVPELARKINKALLRADQISRTEGRVDHYYMAPIVADGEAGFGGPLNVYEMVKLMIEAGVSGAHFEDQLSSEKKCGHLGGKVLVPTSQFIKTLISARLAADVMNVPTVIIARTDSQAAKLLTSDIDPTDHPFIKSNQRTPEGFFPIHNGNKAAIARGLSYSPYADLIWCETSTPDLQEAQQFADAIHREFPNKMLAYNCSPSFNWKRNLDAQTIAKFQRELNSMGYKFQFITLAGFHTLNYSMFDLARQYYSDGMKAYSALQEKEFEAQELGYTAVKHQREVGTGHFDLVSAVISQGRSSTLAMKGSTESEQFLSEKTL